MNTVKQPFLIIILLFFASYLIVAKFSSDTLSNSPVVLSKANPPEILMFGTQSCKYCKLARQFFDKHQLPYTEHDIDTSDKHREMFYLMGGKGTPLIIVNGQVIHGFDERYIRENL